MADATLRLPTVGRSGPIRFQIQLLPRAEGDFMCLIGLERAVSPEECICKFINKPTMVVHPKKAYDEGRRTAVERRRGDPDLNAWQPL